MLSLDQGSGHRWRSGRGIVGCRPNTSVGGMLAKDAESATENVFTQEGAAGGPMARYLEVREAPLFREPRPPFDARMNAMRTPNDWERLNKFRSSCIRISELSPCHRYPSRAGFLHSYGCHRIVFNPIDSSHVESMYNYLRRGPCLVTRTFRGRSPPRTQFYLLDSAASRGA